MAQLIDDLYFFVPNITLERLNNRTYKVMNGKFMLEQIPSREWKVYIENMYEIDINDEITSSNQFKVDYKNTGGWLYVHSSLEGTTINIKEYYGRGRVYVTSARILVSDLNNIFGNEDLEGVLTEINQRVDNLLHGSSNPDELTDAHADAIRNIVYSTLKARLDKDSADIKAIMDEITIARGVEANLNARLNGIDLQVAENTQHITDWVNVKKSPYFAKGDNINDDTTAIQQAIDYVYSLGGGIVYIPAGTFIVSSLQLKSNVYLKGSGNKSVIVQKSYANTNLITLATPNEARIGIFDLFLSGNKSYNSNGGDAIYLDRSGMSYNNTIDSDGHIRIYDVRIYNFNGNGMYITGREGRYKNIVIHECNGNGIYSYGSDNFFSDITCFLNKKSGFKEQGGADKWTMCKAFLNSSDNRSTDAGWYIIGTTNIFTNCEAQENYSHGWKIENTKRNKFIGCIASTNGVTSVDQTTASDLLYNGFQIINSDQISILGGICHDFRKEANNAQNQNIGINIDALSTNIYIEFSSQSQVTNYQDLSNSATIILNSKGISQPFQTPTLLNSWVAYSTSTETAQYYKDTWKRVHLKGTIKSGSSTIFTLPIGYRPSKDLNFLVASHNGTTLVIGRIQVKADGSVLFVDGNNYMISLDGISFLAQQ